MRDDDDISGKPSTAAPSAAATSARRLPIGAEVLGEGRVHFRVWAPGHDRVEVVIERSADAARGQRAGESRTQAHLLAPEDGGYWSALVPCSSASAAGASAAGESVVT